MNPPPNTLPSGPFLRATGLRKTYRIGARLVEVLRGVDLAVEAGEFVALRGASGAGKSTLLHLLGGLDRPNHGEIQFRSQSLAALNDHELAKLRLGQVGFVFQAYHLLPELDALENVCLPARVARRDAAEAEKRARELLRRVGLEHRLEHRPAELSGGEQQRVAIARALMNQPALILADEPTGNLDSHTGEEILNLLCELRAETNATLLIATHDARVAARAPRVVQLLDGQLAG
ncbi:MAG: ABC transporter ATP-binding protein [Proteobacteria bacterium]|nr:ABC transporter ATP-binding protein [Pseudomonadota bacterium]